jgi:hypothetical protein
VLAYDYRAGSARLDDLPEIPISPHLYVLCERCATSLRAPRGWILDDRRTETSPAVSSATVPEDAGEAGPGASAGAGVASDEPRDEPRGHAQRQLAFGYSA